GKTTTKELLANVLGSHYPTHCTKGNFNNHIGVPLTLLRMPQDTEVAVIEMGANHVGEIAMLCEIAAPTHGLITNIGKAHIGEFGGLEGIKKGKSELYDYLRNSNGRIFTNEDESYLSDLAKGSQVIRYGSTNELNPTIPFHTHLDDSHPFVRLSFLSETGNRILANSNLVGHYNFRNICTALAVGRYFKVPSAKMKVAIEEYIPNNNRSQIMKRGSNTFLLDAYNANPTSVKNALEYFAIMQAEKRVAILGDMLELGDYTTVEHQRIITTAVSLGLDDLILVGRNFEAVKRKYKHFADVQQLKTWFDEHTFTNTHFLVKGSRSIQLEQLLLP
ncbi:MAG: Mur ligase family protein, partial [Bacteroidota bacterium]